MSKGVISYTKVGAQAEVAANAQLKELLVMLTYARPSGSASETRFINRFIIPLGMTRDKYGNLWKDVPDESGEAPPLLFSCHTDTVHRSSQRQRVEYGDSMATVSGSNCLGADDTAGCWLMMNMIRKGVPGRYVFHQDEEVGGLGSAHVRDKEPGLLDGIKFAIAFDRKGYTEVITHQGSVRCASDAFGNSLIDVLRPMQFQLSSGGTFTDTANYKRIVPECVNLAVGYFDQHTSHESLDCTFLQVLLAQLVSADWSKLVCARDPKVYEYARGWDDWYDWTGYRNYRDRGSSQPKTKYGKLVDYIRNHPYDVAAFLTALGYDREDIEDSITEAYKALAAKPANKDAAQGAGEPAEGKLIDLSPKQQPLVYVRCDDCGAQFYTELSSAVCSECGSHSVTECELPNDHQLTVEEAGESERRLSSELEVETLQFKDAILAKFHRGELTAGEATDALNALDALHDKVDELSGPA